MTFLKQSSEDVIPRPSIILHGPYPHGCLIYDNSYAEIELLLRMEGDVIQENNLDEAQTHHVLIAESVAKALGVATDVVFRALKNT